MYKVIVISTSNDSDAYSNRLAKHFTKGAKEAGLEVENISLSGKTMEQAYEIGKRLAASADNSAPIMISPTRPRMMVKTDVRVQKMVLVLGEKVLPRRQIIADLGLQQRSRPCFINNYLRPTYEQGFIEFAYPNSPHKPEQAYKLTAKGLELYKQLVKETD